MTKRKISRKKSGKIRLLVDMHSFDYSHYQGVTTYLLNLYNRDYLNVELFFFSHKSEKKLKSYFTNTDFTHIKYKFKSWFLRQLIEVPLACIAFSIDIVHFQYFLPIIPFKTKSIITIHDVLYIEFPEYFPIKNIKYINFYYYLSYKLSYTCLTVSEYSKNSLIKHFGTKKEIHVIENIATLPQCQSVKPLFDFEFILVVSRIEERKGHKIFEKILPYLDTSLKVVFVGKVMEYSRSTFQLFQKYIDDGTLFHLDNLVPEDLSALYFNAKFTVFPSSCEGFGLPVIESFLHRTPCLFLKNTAMSDFDFASEFWCTDYDELVNKVLQFAHHQGKQFVSQELLNEVITRYNSDTLQNKFLSILRKVKAE